MSKIVLASSSPRRQQLLKILVDDFIVVPPQIEEVIDDSLAIEDAIAKISLQKAEDVLNRMEDDVIVISADTVVCTDSKVLLKPVNKQDAADMLRTISGSWHRVITALTVLNKFKSNVSVTVSRVKISNISDKEIYDYIATGEPMDKSGSYSIQGIGAKFVEQISGDFYSIMGLPVNRLYNILDEFCVK